MKNRAQNAARRAIQRWEGEGGAIAEGPQQADAGKRARGTMAPKRVARIGKGDGDKRGQPSRRSN
jgi:hypothetical protein